MYPLITSNGYRGASETKREEGYRKGENGKGKGEKERKLSRKLRKKRRKEYQQAFMFKGSMARGRN